MVTISPPTQADWLSTFVRGQMGVPTAVLPDGSIYILWSYGSALEVVNLALQAVSPLNYKIALYNLAANNLLNLAQDVMQAPPVSPGYFASIRETFGLNSLTFGLVQSSSDQSTSSTLAIPDYVRSLSLADLQYLKTPYGRVYFEIAQRYTTVWGIN